MSKLNNKIAVVTGGNSGIGLATLHQVPRSTNTNSNLLS